MSILVFLEHHGGELQRNALGVLSKAASLGDEVHGVLIGSGVRALAPRAGAYGAAKVHVADDQSLEAPLPQPRVDVIAQLVRDGGYATVLFGQSVLAADIAAALAARLEAGLNWDLVDVVQQDGTLVGKRPALQDTVYVDVGWKSEPRIALFRSGTFDPKETGGDAQVEDVNADVQEFSKAATMIEQAHAESEGPSIEDADVIVAGGTDGQDRRAQALHRSRHLGSNPTQGGHAELRHDRRDQQGRQRTGFRVLRSRRRRRST